MSKKCALVEYNSCNDELFPSLVYYLNRMGYSVDIYTDPKAFQKYIFFLMEGLSFRFLPLTWLGIEKEYDFFVFNSFEYSCSLGDLPPRIRTYFDIQYMFPDVPKIYTLHSDAENWQSFFPELLTPDSSRQFWVLAPFLQDFYSNIEPVRWIMPSYYGSPKTQQALKADEPDNETIHIAVQGILEFHRRNYDDLVYAVNHLARQETQDFIIDLVGYNDTPDGRKFRNWVDTQDLTNYFTFQTGLISYHKYFSMLVNDQFILPLIDQTHSNSYMLNRASSAVPLILGFQKPAILYEPYAELYGLETCSFTYVTGKLANAIETAVNAPSSQLRDMQDQLLVKQNELLEQSLAHVQQTLTDLGIPIGPSLLSDSPPAVIAS